MPPSMPPKPQPNPPANTWSHYALWQLVQESLRALPGYFQSKTNVEGMLATDIFTLNSPLSATIEEQVVATLNLMRPLWDPDKEYQSYSFVRQSQTFPDVLLRRKTNGQNIILGIELKGWYLLGKEAMPTYRFTASPSACALPDLICVVPWTLSNVLAGAPVVYSPWIELARYSAEKRNYYWEYERNAKADKSIKLSQGVGPYPVRTDKISDVPMHDGGGNFGRLARYGIMQDFIGESLQMKIRGIPALDWVNFFGKHNEKSSD